MYAKEGALAEREIKLREVRGRAHGDCGSCEIFRRFSVDHTATESDELECRSCYMAGRTLDFEDRRWRDVGTLNDLAVDRKTVSFLGEGRRITAQEALDIFTRGPGNLCVRRSITNLTTPSA